MRESTQIPVVSDPESVSVAIVEAVAAVTETPSTDLPPLYEWVNPDALEQLFDPAPRQTSGVVAFEVADCTVTVTSDGTVSATDDVDEVAASLRAASSQATDRPATPLGREGE